MKNRKRNYQIILFASLLFVSVLAATMVALRILYSGESRFIFLIWNLFLAWLPLLFAWLAYRYPVTAVVYSPLWLIFFPNAPYLVTDLIHLRPTILAPLWYDAILLFLFALTGLLLGVLSLYFMQALVVRRFGGVVSWLFVIAASGLSGYGVYLGRFLRWNSWDIFTQPRTVAFDIVNSLTNPQFFLKTYTVSLSLTAMMLLAYVIMVSLPQLSFQSGD